MYSDPNKFIDHLSNKFIENGTPIAGGWATYQVAVLPKNCGPVQREETMKAFYAGAQHLYSMIMHGLTSGDEITQTDLDRLANIETELSEFASDFIRNQDNFKGKDN